MVKRKFSLEKVEQWKETNQSSFHLAKTHDKLLVAPTNGEKTLPELEGPQAIEKLTKRYQKRFFLHFELESMSNTWFIVWLATATAYLIAELGVFSFAQIATSPIRMGIFIGLIIVSYLRRSYHQKQLRFYELGYCYFYIEEQRYKQEENEEPLTDWSLVKTIHMKENKPLKVE